MARFPREFYLVTGLATLAFIGSSVIQPFFSLYVDEVGASPIELGLIISLFSYTTLLTRLPLGILSNKVGIWWVVPLALIGQSVCYIFYGFATNSSQFYVIRIIHAIALASLQPTLMTITLTILPEDRRGEGVGIYLTSVGLSMMGGPLLCSLLLSLFDYRTTLLLSSMIPLFTFLVYIGLLKTETMSRQLSREARKEPVNKSSWSSLMEIVTIRSVQALTYSRFAFAVSLSFITTLYAVYAVNSLYIAPAVYALLYSLRGLANTVSRLPTGRISDTIGRKKPLLLSFILLTGVFLLFSEARDPVMIGFTMFLYGTAHGIRAVSEWAFFADTVLPENRTLANSYFHSVFDLGLALGATFAGSAAMVVSTPTILKGAAVLMSSSVIVIALTQISRKSSTS